MKLVFDGNIGCGKSSVLKKIIASKCIDLPVFNEPLNDWDKWVDLFYSDMNKYAFGFQMRVLKSHMDKKEVDNGIFERSPLSCQKVFGQLLFEDNKMTQLEWDLTNEFNNDYGWVPDIVVYLKCDPEICYQRIQKRNRDGEHSITLDYLKRIHDKYEEMYSRMKCYNKIKIIEIDASKSSDAVYEEVLEKAIRNIRFSINRFNDYSYKSI
jgi:deoxyadenosine/deoxycytidine kinase